uniref:Uncharacterized protein n=1 Tax=Takifugu rubripes TaxID=31033 RepID=A0A674N3C4_TAKRU
MVLFSNFSSPEYIMELRQWRRKYSSPRCPGSHAGFQLSGKVRTYEWSPYLGLTARRLQRSTLPEPLWLPLATSPS